ncbi:hypothetical protein HDU76_014014 [Blyttiomyces sp. JEL0837]|nr:hypothetical protein HDU76_014014 [Blyttiomyces sp. JEL0837]
MSRQGSSPIYSPSLATVNEERLGVRSKTSQSQYPQPRLPRSASASSASSLKSPLRSFTDKTPGMRPRTGSYEDPAVEGQPSVPPATLTLRARRQSMGDAEALMHQVNKEINILQTSVSESKGDGDTSAAPRVRAMIMILTEDDLRPNSRKMANTRFLKTQVGRDVSSRDYSVSYKIPIAATPSISPKSSVSSSSNKNSSSIKSRLSVTDSDNITRGMPRFSQVTSGASLSESIEDYTNKQGFAMAAKGVKSSRTSSAGSTKTDKGSQGQHQCANSVQPQDRLANVVKETGLIGLLKWIRGGMKAKSNRSGVMIAA